MSSKRTPGLILDRIGIRRVKFSRSMACLLPIAGIFVGLITRLKEGESMTVGEIKDYCKDQVRLVNHSMIHG